MNEPEEDTSDASSEEHLESAKNVDSEKQIYDFRDLASNRDEFFIRLDGETYRLRRTRNNKLILMK